MYFLFPLADYRGSFLCEILLQRKLMNAFPDVLRLPVTPRHPSLVHAINSPQLINGGGSGPVPDAKWHSQSPMGGLANGSSSSSSRCGGQFWVILSRFELSFFFITVLCHKM